MMLCYVIIIFFEKYRNPQSQNGNTMLSGLHVPRCYKCVGVYIHMR